MIIPVSGKMIFALVYTNWQPMYIYCLKVFKWFANPENIPNGFLYMHRMHNKQLYGQFGKLLVRKSCLYIYTTGKNMEYYFISAIYFHFYEVCRCFCIWNTFLRVDITSGWVISHTSSKTITLVLFSVVDTGYKACCSIARLLPYTFVC